MFLPAFSVLGLQVIAAGNACLAFENFFLKKKFYFVLWVQVLLAIRFGDLKAHSLSGSCKTWGTGCVDRLPSEESGSFGSQEDHSQHLDINGLGAEPQAAAREVCSQIFSREKLGYGHFCLLPLHFLGDSHNW